MKEKKTELVSFRLTKSEFEPYKSVIESTDINKTDFFRAVFLNQQYNFQVNENKPIEYDRLLFLFNKTSNNINQIAKNLNISHKKGAVPPKLYMTSLNKLIDIENLLKEVIDAC